MTYFKAFIAIVAVLMHAFWPVVGELRSAAPSTVQVVCVVHGVMEVPTQEPADDPTRPCAMCSAAGVALGSFYFPSIAPDPAVQGRPSFETLLSPSQRAHYSSSSPRAPPFVS